RVWCPLSSACPKGARSLRAAPTQASSAASSFRRRSRRLPAPSSRAGTPTGCRRCSVPEAPVLEVAALVKHYPVRGGVLSRGSGTVQAVDGGSLLVGRGEPLGVV